MNDRVQINSHVKQYTPNGLPQIKSNWKNTLKKKKITLLARNKGDDLASPMSPWLIAKKTLYILITFFFWFSLNVLGYWKQRCFQYCNKK